MFHLFFQTYVASVFIWMLYMFHTYVASVLSRYRVCLQWFSSVFSRIFASISNTCFKCFIRLLLYVASIASGYFKSRSAIASLSSPSATSPWCLLLACCCLASFSDHGGGAASARSLLPLRGQVAPRFTFSVIRGDAKMGCSHWWAYDWELNHSSVG